VAKKYGGKFSPDGSAQSAVREAVVDARKVDAAGAKANVLFIPGVVLAFLSLNEGAIGLITGLGGAVLLTLAAWLTRDGLRAAAAYDQRKVARKPAFPRKIVGSIFTGLGITAASLMNDPSVLAAIGYGVVAAGLHSAAFGFDPLRDKRMEGIDTFQQDRVARVVDEAEDHLASMKDHIDSIGDRHLEKRTAQFQAAARRMIRTVEEDPRDLRCCSMIAVTWILKSKCCAIGCSAKGFSRPHKGDINV